MNSRSWRYANSPIKNDNTFFDAYEACGNKQERRCKPLFRPASAETPVLKEPALQTWTGQSQCSVAPGLSQRLTVRPTHYPVKGRPRGDAISLLVPIILDLAPHPVILDRNLSILSCQSLVGKVLLCRGGLLCFVQCLHARNGARI